MSEQGTGLDAIMTEAIDRLVQGGQIRSVFQPIVDLRSGRVIACEALTRPDPASGFPHAGALFEAADKTGRIADVERMARASSFDAANDWPFDTSLFMNCSPTVVCEEGFAESLIGEVQSAGGIRAERIVLEITERAESADHETLLARVQELRDAGFQIAIDDVGAGTSGLNRIVLLKPNWLKLDRELIVNIEQNAVARNLVRFIASFARLSGANLIAEGIETQAELDALAELGVNYAQGFHLGRPVSRDDLAFSQVDCARSAADRASRIRFHDPRTLELQTIMRGIALIGEDSDVSAAVQAIRSTPDCCVGILNYSGQVHGMLRIDQLEDAVTRGYGSIPAATLASRTISILDANSVLTDAIEVAAGRPDARSGDPIILTEGVEAIGAVTVRDLLHLAGLACENVQFRSAPVTGLPGRVRCEQRVELEISRIAEMGLGAMDVGFFDLMNMSPYNTVFGFEFGDQLIRSLAGIILGAIEERTPDEYFVGHIGDDRFIALAPRGVLAEVANLIATRFLGEASHLEKQEARVLTDVATPHPRSLVRVGGITGDQTRADVFALERTLREEAAKRYGVEGLAPIVLVQDSSHHASTASSTDPGRRAA